MLAQNTPAFVNKEQYGKKKKKFKNQNGNLNKASRLEEAAKRDTKQGKHAKKALAKKILK